MYYGKHVSITGKEPYEEFNTIQIFTKGPQSMRNIQIKLETEGRRLFVHSPYPMVGIWSKNFNHLLKEELLKSDSLGSEGYVVHMKEMSEQQLFEKLKAIESLYMEHSINTKIFFENQASKSKSPEKRKFNSIKDMERLFMEIKEHFPLLKVGLCIDTAHLFSAGNFSLEELEEYINTVGDDHPILIHFNGAYQKNMGTGKDQHVLPMSKEDAVWSKNNARDFLEICSHKKIPLIVEVKQLSSGFKQFMSLF